MGTSPSSNGACDHPPLPRCSAGAGLAPCLIRWPTIVHPLETELIQSASRVANVFGMISETIRRSTVRVAEISPTLASPKSTTACAPASVAPIVPARVFKTRMAPMASSMRLCFISRRRAAPMLPADLRSRRAEIRTERGWSRAMNRSGPIWRPEESRREEVPFAFRRCWTLKSHRHRRSSEEWSCFLRCRILSQPPRAKGFLPFRGSSSRGAAPITIFSPLPDVTAAVAWPEDPRSKPVGGSR